jgi:hypothetical protein
MQAQKHQQHIGVKQLILVAILFMMIGTAMELYLLDHYEGTLQLIPLLCIGATLLVMLLLFVRKTGAPDGHLPDPVGIDRPERCVRGVSTPSGKL